MKFNPYGALMINRGNYTWIEFHLYFYSKHKVSTIHIANVANLDRFVTLSISFFVYFISIYYIWLNYYYWDTVSIN